jgi:hypothetical protein
MTYSYEDLGPERFQQVAQALLVKEWPDVQCLPVAQPDGGRDATAGDVHGGFIVFQVKFVRRPETIDKPGDWVEEVLNGELAKAQRLISQGATAYYLITNVKGSAHPTNGSIDRAKRFFTDHLSVPGRAWWRDDLDRRLDGAFDVKWTYPELLSGPDALRAVLQLMTGGSSRETAIRAFLTGQYEADRDIRFRQVDLQSRLLTFFVDVPAASPTRTLVRRRYPDVEVAIRRARVLGKGSRPRLEFEEATPGRRRRPIVGGADLLLAQEFQSALPRIVLEGAPGQGKSTLAQYVCQVHRARLLDKQSDLADLPVHHRECPVRLPFKVDLRDLASWLSGEDPFRPGEPATGDLTLETFLARLVSSFSGGMTFGVDDLHETVATGPVVLLFDGLDEVAEIQVREKLVSEIELGLARLDVSALSLQAVVTSRPAAFSNSPGFSAESFAYLELVDMTIRLMHVYADKWLRARRLPDTEAEEVRRILTEKLKEPHIRDLARNPMQLAILLSLIASQGVALPDKRTALYDAYMERFFSREAEKSDVVRDHRDLLTQLHQYLAWKLHSEAETQRSSGRIAEDTLKDMIEAYLEAKGHDESTVVDLFHGMVERVVAIVSRVEGTFEFDVQPLREYFAGRFLYETAPYSPPGGEQSGTKPERFAALARNYYWLNVARFYAGCYSRGELASLADGLADLSMDEEFAFLAHPRLLGLTLQTDWVFAQEPQAVSRVIDLVASDPGFKIFVAEEPTIPPELPDDCGRARLASLAFEKLEAELEHKDYRRALCEILRRNLSPGVMAKWRQHLSEGSDELRNEWIQLGILLGAAGELSLDEIDPIRVATSHNGLATLWELFDAGWHDLASDGDLARVLIDGLLDEEGMPAHPSEATSIVGAASWCFAPWTYVWAYEDVEHRTTLAQAWQRFPSGFDPESVKGLGPGRNATEKKCLAVVQALVSQGDRPIEEWAHSLDPWNAVTETARDAWGERMAVLLLGSLSSGIADTESGRGASDPFDIGTPLTHRARYARLRAGNPHWWARQLEQSPDERHRDWLLSLLLAWGSEKTLMTLQDVIAAEAALGDERRFSRVYEMTNGITWCVSGLRARRKLNLDASEWSAAPEEVTALLQLRIPDSKASAWRRAFALGTSGTSRAVRRWRLEAHLERALADSTKWGDVLAEVRRAYEHGDGTELEIFRIGDPRLRARHGRLPLSVAQEILKDAHLYPLTLIEAAEIRKRQEVSIVPVGDVAASERWAV